MAVHGCGGRSFTLLAQAVVCFIPRVLRIVHTTGLPRIVGHGIHLHPLAVVLAICVERTCRIGGDIPAIPRSPLPVTYRHLLEHKGS